MSQRFISFLREYFESPVAGICLVLTLVFAGCAIFAPLISPTNPYDLTSFSINDARLPPGSRQMTAGAKATVPVQVKDGQGEASAMLGSLRATLKVSAPNANSLQLVANAGEVSLAQLRLRGLPPTASVDGARKHPVRAEWTVVDPHAPVTISFPGGWPKQIALSVELDSQPTPTGTTFTLGTDSYGRDLLSAVIYGIRISFVVGAVGAIGAMLIGTSLGLLSAWRGGRVDTLVMRMVDFQLSIPSLMVGLLILTILGKGVDRILIAIVLINWTVFARTVRSVALAELRSDYVDAARGLRLSALRINLRHILPNCLPPLLVLLTINVASAITLEASLSFLGVGLPLTQPSLGMLIANGYEYMFSNLYWIAIYPGLVLMLMVVSINVVGDRLRDMLNPQLKR